MRIFLILEDGSSFSEFLYSLPQDTKIYSVEPNDYIGGTCSLFTEFLQHSLATLPLHSLFCIIGEPVPKETE